MAFTVYLSGEIHTNWRDELIEGCRERGLDVDFTSAVTTLVAAQPRLTHVPGLCVALTAPRHAAAGSPLA